MKVIKWLDEYLEEALLVLLLFAMTIIMGTQIFSRYVLNAALSWSEELTQYMFVWATFISASFCVKKRISIKIEQFINVLPNRGKTGLRLFRHTVVLLFCLYMIPFSADYLNQAVDMGSTSAAMGIPMAYIQSAPLAGFILLSVRVLEAWIREFRHMLKGEVSR